MESMKDLLKGKEGIEEAINKFANLTPEEYAEMQAKWYNDSLGDLDKKDGIKCSKCKNKGYIQFVKDADVWSKSCECMKRREQIARAKRSGLGEYLEMRSGDYDAKEDWQKEIKSKLIEFCLNHNEDNVWFAIIGQVGSGKTLIGSIIANHLLLNENREVQYTTWTDFISKLKRDMMGDNTNQVSEYLEQIKKVDVLFLDEVLKKYNETDLKYLIEIINYRYTNSLKTIITSEKLLDELLNIDEATFSRVIEKAEQFCIEIPRDRTKNYRLKNILKK